MQALTFRSPSPESHRVTGGGDLGPSKRVRVADWQFDKGHLRRICCYHLFSHDFQEVHRWNICWCWQQSLACTLGSPQTGMSVCSLDSHQPWLLVQTLCFQEVQEWNICWWNDHWIMNCHSFQASQKGHPPPTGSPNPLAHILVPGQ